MRIEMIDAKAKAPFEGDLPADVWLEMVVVDGAQYDTKFEGEAAR